MLPSGWKNKTLNDIAIIKSGGTPSRKKDSYWNGTIPWVRTTEVQNCYIQKVDIKEYHQCSKIS